MPTPGQPIAKQTHPYDNVYVMYYRHGLSVNVSKGFYHEGDVLSAATRAREHCKIMGYHYVYTLPLVSDLQRDEDYKLGKLVTPVVTNVINAASSNSTTVVGTVVK